MDFLQSSEVVAGTGFDWVLIWTMIGALAGLLSLMGIVVSVLTYRRANPKRRLIFDVTAGPLLRSGPELPPLTVMFDSTEIPDAHLIEFQVHSDSRSDIPSSAFDGGRPIEFKLTGVGRVLVQGLEDIDNSIVLRTRFEGGREEVEGSLTILIEPHLIKAGAGGRLLAITDGRPVLETVSTLVDINVDPVNFVPQEPTPYWQDKRLQILAPLFLLLGLGIGGLTYALSRLLLLP